METVDVEDDDPNVWSSLLLLERFQNGDNTAANLLFSRYFARLTLLARSQLSDRLTRRTDPEDIVLSVYRSFFIAAKEGRYRLTRGGDLWRLLSSIARHKLLKKVRYETAACRAYYRDESLHRVAEDQLTKDARPSHQTEPSLEEAIALADELEWTHSRLNAFDRRVLELRLQGLQISEIAKACQRSERSVRRSLTQIRNILSDRLNDA